MDICCLTAKKEIIRMESIRLHPHANIIKHLLDLQVATEFERLKTEAQELYQDSRAEGTILSVFEERIIHPAGPNQNDEFGQDNDFNRGNNEDYNFVKLTIPLKPKWKRLRNTHPGLIQIIEGPENFFPMALEISRTVEYFKQIDDLLSRWMRIYTPLAQGTMQSESTFSAGGGYAPGFLGGSFSLGSGRERAKTTTPATTESVNLNLGSEINTEIMTVIDELNGNVNQFVEKCNKGYNGKPFTFEVNAYNSAYTSLCSGVTENSILNAYTMHNMCTYFLEQLKGHYKDANKKRVMLMNLALDKPADEVVPHYKF